MKEKPSSNFLIGLVIGSLLVLLFWYYQKSTSAEDGALAMLDRLAAAQNRMREMQAQMTARGEAVLGRMGLEGVETAVSKPAQPDDLQQVTGIGPVFAERLQAAGITTFVALRQLSAGQLAEILDVREGRAENILAAAQHAA